MLTRRLSSLSDFDTIFLRIEDLVDPEDYHELNTVRNMAIDIGTSEQKLGKKVDLTVLTVASLLLNSNSATARLALRKFKEKITPEQVENIINIIDAYNVIDNPPVDLLELDIIFDAINITNMGTTGIIHVLECTDDPLFSVEMSTEESTRFETLLELLNIKYLLKTKRGREIGKKRHDFMVSFIEQFLDERGSPEEMSFWYRELARRK